MKNINEAKKLTINRYVVDGSHLEINVYVEINGEAYKVFAPPINPTEKMTALFMRGDTIEELEQTMKERDGIITDIIVDRDKEKIVIRGDGNPPKKFKWLKPRRMSDDIFKAFVEK